MKLIYALLLSFGLVLNVAVADETSVVPPQEVVKQVTDEVLNALKGFNGNDTANLDKVSQKVKELILPHMDFEAMSKKVLGKHWRKANPDQRKQFVAEFKRLLIRTYETSLSKYSEEKVQFLPFRQGKQPERLAIVKSEIIRSSGPTIPINYNLLKKPGVPWKVYDIGIEGISLVTNYRSSFSREIERNGIDALIQSLKDRNEKPGAEAAKQS